MDTNNKKLRVAIVGCGRAASEFEELSDEHPASIAGAFAEIKDTEIVAAANRGKERLYIFGKRWGVDALYHDYREMIERESPDIVAIATHPPLHEDIVEAACSNGVKGIFCEKPIALDLEDCDRIIQQTKRADVKLVVNCMRRFSGQYEAVKQLVKTKALGDLVHMVGHCQGIKPIPEWVADTEGPLLHDAVHLLDIMRFFAGNAESLIGTARNPTKRFRVEDTGFAVIQFENGVEGLVVVDEMAEYSDFSIELNFTRGRIRLGTFCEGMWKSTLDNNNENGWWQHLEPSPLPEPAWSGTAILNSATNLVKAIKENAVIRCDAYDGRAAVELIMAIYESQRVNGSRIHLPLKTGPSSLLTLQNDGIL